MIRYLLKTTMIMKAAIAALLAIQPSEAFASGHSNQPMQQPSPQQGNRQNDGHNPEKGVNPDTYVEMEKDIEKRIDEKNQEVEKLQEQIAVLEEEKKFFQEKIESGNSSQQSPRNEQQGAAQPAYSVQQQQPQSVSSFNGKNSFQLPQQQGVLSQPSNEQPAQQHPFFHK